MFPFLGFGQCPDGGSIFLTSQAEVNEFGLNYPNCSEIQTGLFISGSDITDLTSLAGLTEVGFLEVVNNPLLINLNGLGLARIYGNFPGNFIQIRDNLALQDISALSSIVQPPISINQVINISNNPQLTSLNGLQGISSPFFEGIGIYNNDSLTNLNGLEGIINTLTLTVSNNDNLVNFSGLDNLEVVYDNLKIENNSSLVSFVGLENLGYVTSDLKIIDNFILNDISQFNGTLGSTLEISNNPNLSICNTASICEYLSGPFNTNNLTIRNNAEGCNSYFQVAYACSSTPINDDIDEVIHIELNETLEIYSEFGTESIQIPSCNDINREDVWLTFNLETSSLVDILIDDNHNIQVWEDGANNLIQTENACATGSLNDISITANTNYYLQVWSNDSSGAIGLFDITVQDATLSLDNDVFEGFIMYPNPVSSLLTFRANDTIDTIEVYNLLGQNVKRIDPKTTQGKIDMSTFNSGMYIIKVGIDNTFASYRIVKK